MWEDVRNKNGGRFIIRLLKNLAEQVFDELLFAQLGEQFDPDMVGMTVNFRSNEDIIAVWHRTAGNAPARKSIFDTIKRTLSLSSQTILEYREHPIRDKEKSKLIWYYIDGSGKVLKSDEVKNLDDNLDKKKDKNSY
mmetsp:Transcript_59276/g.128710  ORF Transcript_59276/g.128710 Transcript_59276/m.128710 type:complete len:137 (-) Transcript_59276:319-729(-)